MTDADRPFPLLFQLHELVNSHCICLATKRSCFGAITADRLLSFAVKVVKHMEMKACVILLALVNSSIYLNAWQHKLDNGLGFRGPTARL
jgi:hypothetical protein